MCSEIEIYALVAGTARCFGGARPSSMQKSNTGELGSLRGILAKIGEQRLPQFRLHEFGGHASVLCPHHPTQLIKPLKKMLIRKIVAISWEYMRWEEERYAHGGREELSHHNKQASERQNVPALLLHWSPTRGGCKLGILSCGNPKASEEENNNSS